MNESILFIVFFDLYINHMPSRSDQKKHFLNHISWALIRVDDKQ